MNNINSNSFDQDFLWIFHQIERPAICLSLDGHVIALTPHAEKLFAVKKNVLNKPITTLFTPFGLEIIFSKKNKNLTIGVVDNSIAADSLDAKRIMELDWKIKPKKAVNNKIIGFILYVEGQANLEYLTQVYKVVTGQEKLKHGSVENYAESIKEYLENIIACMPGNVYWMDKNCVYLGCNDNAARFTGLSSRQEAVGMDYEEMERKAGWVVGHTASWKKDDLEVITTGKAKLNVEEEPILLSNGKEIFYLTSRVPIFDDSKKNVIGVVGISIDITDRKLIERELLITRERAEKAEKRLLAKINQEVTGQVFDEEKLPSAYAKNIQNYLEKIIACMPGNVYWMDKNCVYLGCNDNVAKFAGLKFRKEVAGKTYEDVERIAGWTVGHTASWKNDDLEVIATGKPKLNVEEKPVLLPDGTEIYYLTSRVPIFDDKQNVIGVLGVSIDISDRKKAERLQKEKDVAEKTSRLMKMLAGSIAHEIRTPLAIIGINTDLLMMNSSSTTSKNKEAGIAEKCFKNIKYAIGLAAYIIDNILIMLRTMASGKPTKNKFERLSIAEDVKKMVETYPFLEHEKQLIHVRLGKLKDFVYYGDKGLTQHTLFNLVRNALHAIKEAEKGEIKITFEEGTSHNNLKFTDTAFGISEELLPKIFEQFETGRSDGAGLGLAFCKMIMESYGGEISCVSEKGKYTEFILSFPKVSD